MNLVQLRDYCNLLLEMGVPSDLAACVAADGEVIELDDIRLMDGTFREDPSPKMGGMPHMTGRYVLLVSSVAAEDVPALEAAKQLPAPTVPAKEWTPGKEWWLRPVR